MTRIIVLSVTCSFWIGSIALAVSPTLVADIRPSGGSEPSNLIVFQDKLYFSANNGIHGKELWKWDGTTASLAGDLNPGIKWSDPSEPLVFDNTLYFIGLHSSQHGRELWKWDGSSAERLTSIGEVDLDTGARGPKLVEYDGKVLFAGEEQFYGGELWSWDVGQAVRLTDLNLGSLSSLVDQFIDFKGKIFFTATHGSGLGGKEIWSWDGMTASRAFDHPIGQPESTYPISLKVIGDLLYYSDEDSQRGQELWIWDGENYPAVIDILPGTASAAPGSFTEFKGDIYFTARDPAHGRELWKWDGTNASLAADIRPGQQSSSPNWLTVFDGNLYFSAYNALLGEELWKWDGTQATMVADINPGLADDGIDYLTVYNNALYFSANDPVHGRELWKLAAVPEPSSGLLMAGLSLLAIAHRRSSRAIAAQDQ